MECSGSKLTKPPPPQVLCEGCEANEAVAALNEVISCISLTSKIIAFFPNLEISRYTTIHVA